MTSFHISTDKGKLDIAMIHQYLSSDSYWAQGRTLEEVEKSITHSLCFGAYNEEDLQVGFARIVTDYSIFAWVMDVFILPRHQGLGLGKQLMDAVMQHAELKGIKRWGLNTQDAHTLYAKYGFHALEHPEFSMERLDPAYAKRLSEGDDG